MKGPWESDKNWKQTRKVRLFPIFGCLNQHFWGFPTLFEPHHPPKNCPQGSHISALRCLLQMSSRACDDVSTRPAMFMGLCQDMFRTHRDRKAKSCIKTVRDELYTQNTVESFWGLHFRYKWYTPQSCQTIKRCFYWEWHLLSGRSFTLCFPRPAPLPHILSSFWTIIPQSTHQNSPSNPKYDVGFRLQEKRTFKYIFKYYMQ